MYACIIIHLAKRRDVYYLSKTNRCGIYTRTSQFLNAQFFQNQSWEYVRVFDKIFTLDQIGLGQAMGEPLYFQLLQPCFKW